MSPSPGPDPGPEKSVAWPDLRGGLERAGALAAELAAEAEEQARLARRLEDAHEVRMLARFASVGFAPARRAPFVEHGLILLLHVRRESGAVGRGAGRDEAAAQVAVGTRGRARRRQAEGRRGRRPPQGADAGADRAGAATLQSPRRRAPTSAGTCVVRSNLRLIIRVMAPPHPVHLVNVWELFCKFVNQHCIVPLPGCRIKYYTIALFSYFSKL
uniref:Uncharacterized protein n=1 Tax=Triticum urartu TaxID=4572 RepID=A0A8R7QB00_TRIUA